MPSPVKALPDANVLYANHLPPAAADGQNMEPYLAYVISNL
jgi:hypothetical protein